jgi:hypothetical protein
VEARAPQPISCTGGINPDALIAGEPGHELEITPLDLIRPGDMVIFNADEGFVEIEQEACSQDRSGDK